MSRVCRADVGNPYLIALRQSCPSAQNPEIWKVSCPHCSVSELAIYR
jgi:hypothetical protein